MDPREGIRGAVGQITRMMLCLDRGQGGIGITPGGPF